MLFDKEELKKQEDPKDLIKKRRLQILVHSYLYYKLNTNLVDDFTFDRWCKELFTLQIKYPKHSMQGVFPCAFQDWTGFSGYDLFKNDVRAEQWAKSKAEQLLRIKDSL